MPDLNPALQALFAEHGVSVIPLENKALLQTSPLALLESRVTQQQYPNAVSSQLDVRLTVNHHVIVECFGDLGATPEEAARHNLQNFAQGSFHVLLAALQHAEHDEQIDITRWQVDAQEWKVYSGNYSVKSSGGRAVAIPEELMTRIESIIRTRPLTREYHWFRFFMCCLDNELLQLEFLADNEPYPAAKPALESLDWTLTPEFYSIRLFLLLHRA